MKDFNVSEPSLCNGTYMITHAKQLSIHVLHPPNIAVLMLLFYIIFKVPYLINQQAHLNDR